MVKAERQDTGGSTFLDMLAGHSEGHKTGRAGWLRAAVLGANDGLVSTSSLLVGVAASGASTGAVSPAVSTPTAKPTTQRRSTPWVVSSAIESFPRPRPATEHW